MATLRETSEWSPTIYQIERTDPLMGGEFGINNVQARQLANRTQYLLEYFLRGHGADGGHQLGSDDIAELAAISEQKLGLSESTRDIHATSSEYNSTLDSIEYALSNISGDAGTPLSALYKALLLSWKYGDYGFDFCLFTDSFTYIDSLNASAVIETIAGDESIDVADTSTLRVGETYVLQPLGLSRSETVRITAVLNSKRILVDHAVPFSCSGGTLSKTTWDINPKYALTTPGSILISREIDSLSSHEFVVLTICHQEADATYSVEYANTLTDTWHTAEFSKTEADGDGCYISRYRIKGGVFYLKITANTASCVDHMVVHPDPDNYIPSMVRTPVNVGPLVATRFGALYSDTYSAAEVIVSDDQNFTKNVRTVLVGQCVVQETQMSLYTAVTAQLSIVPGKTYWWKVRYKSARGYWSLYSVATSFTAE